MLQLVPGCRAIASGNWGCGAFCGDPYLKVVLQWVAASLARAPRLLYFTFGDPRLQQVSFASSAQVLVRVGQLCCLQCYCGFG